MKGKKGQRGGYSYQVALPPSPLLGRSRYSLVLLTGNCLLYCLCLTDNFIVEFRILKAYQQCRIEVFRDNCDSTVAEWNNHAFTEYYGKYATEVHCNIGRHVKLY